MSDLIFQSAGRVRVVRHSAARALASACKRLRREQTGQDVVEYMGVIVIIAAIVTAIVALHLGTTIGHDITTLINNIFGGGGGGGGGAGG